jgi:hypothetical protein
VGEPVAALRAVEALEHMGTPEARQVLEALARESHPGFDRVQEEARASLRRLAR